MKRSDDLSKFSEESIEAIKMAAQCGSIADMQDDQGFIPISVVAVLCCSRITNQDGLIACYLDHFRMLLAAVLSGELPAREPVSKLSLIDYKRMKGLCRRDDYPVPTGNWLVHSSDFVSFYASRNIYLSFPGGRDGPGVTTKSAGLIQTSEDGRELVNRRHAKQRVEKDQVKKAAAGFISRGRMNHAEIAKELLVSGGYELTPEKVRNAVKEQCREMNREDLILGDNRYCKPS